MVPRATILSDRLRLFDHQIICQYVRILHVTIYATLTKDGKHVRGRGSSSYVYHRTHCFPRPKVCDEPIWIQVAIRNFMYYWNR